MQRLLAFVQYGKPVFGTSDTLLQMAHCKRVPETNEALKGHRIYVASRPCISLSMRFMILYPPFVGVACGVPVGCEPGYEGPPQADNSKSMLSSSKHNVAKKVCDNLFFCIMVPSFCGEKHGVFHHHVYVKLNNL